MDSPLGKEFKAFRKKVGVALAIISIGCAIGIWQSRQAGDDAGHAANAAALAAHDAQHAIHKINKDTIARLDESCTQKERLWISTVHSIRLTYKYISELSADQAADPLNKLIIGEFPRTYKQAGFDKPISACKEKGIGLSKPIVELPPYKDLSKLVK